MSFLDSTLQLATIYAQQRNLGIADIDVRVSLADGSAPYLFKGIAGRHAQADHVMLSGSSDAGGAIVVREQHVVKVELGAVSGGRQAIGFQAETA